MHQAIVWKCWIMLLWGHGRNEPQWVDTIVSGYVTMNTYQTAFMFIVSYNTVSVWPRVVILSCCTSFCRTTQSFQWKMNIVWMADMELINPYGSLAPLLLMQSRINFYPRNQAQASADFVLAEIVWFTTFTEVKGMNNRLCFETVMSHVSFFL